MKNKKNPGIFIAYAEMWRYGLNFGGRTSRRFFLLALLLDYIFVFAANGILYFMDSVLLMSELVGIFTGFWYVGRVIVCATLILPLYSRRLHDANKKALGLIIARIVFILFGILYLLDVNIKLNDTLNYLIIGIGVISLVANFLYFLDCILYPSDSAGARFGDYTDKDICGTMTDKEKRVILEHKPKFSAAIIEKNVQNKNTEEGEEN